MVKVLIDTKAELYPVVTLSDDPEDLETYADSLVEIDDELYNQWKACMRELHILKAKLKEAKENGT